MLQWNIWMCGTVVPNAFESLVGEIERLQPDFITISEVWNRNDSTFCSKIIESLANKKLTYYAYFGHDTGVLSKYPIHESSKVYAVEGKSGTINRIVTSVGKQEFAVYTAHLDYLNDAYYDAKGYDGSTWQKRPIPESVEEILSINNASSRDDAIKEFVKVSKEDIEQGRIVILGGDFNEPSHLDWTNETKDLYDHNGFVIPWTCTSLLEENGFIDTYRSLYQDPIHYPGFTFPSDNPLVPVERLAWGPEADERDRIDFIFYYPNPMIKLSNASLFGPQKSILRSQRVDESSLDPFITPLYPWPTDHKGVLVTFELKEGR